MLFWAPHTVSVQTASEAKSGGQHLPLALASAVSVKCQVTPITSDRATENFGVVLDNLGMQLLCNPGDIAKFTVGSKVVFGGVSYSVAARGKEWTAESITQVGEILLQVIN
jgi:hypothetical protein